MIDCPYAGMDSLREHMLARVLWAPGSNFVPTSEPTSSISQPILSNRLLDAESSVNRPNRPCPPNRLNRPSVHQCGYAMKTKRLLKSRMWKSNNEIRVGPIGDGIARSTGVEQSGFARTVVAHTHTITLNRNFGIISKAQ